MAQMPALMPISFRMGRPPPPWRRAELDVLASRNLRGRSAKNDRGNIPAAPRQTAFTATFSTVSQATRNSNGCIWPTTAVGGVAGMGPSIRRDRFSVGNTTGKLVGSCSPGTPACKIV